MEVDHKPSAWPFVAMLVALLLFCVTVPLFWRGNGDRSAPESMTRVVKPQRHGADRSRSERAAKLPLAARRSPPDDDLLALWGPPTIEELIAVRISSARRGTVREWPVLIRPIDAPRESIPPPPSLPNLPSEQDVQSVFETAGRCIANYSLARSLPRFVGGMVRTYRVWAESTVDVQQATAGSERVPSLPAVASSLRLLDPRGRAATERSPKRFDVGVKDTVTTPDPWCVPEVLIEHLERLACHPYSSRWAERTISQLRALTNRERLDGPDVQPILLQLSSAAREAARLADDSGDDRVRVELLRAHWALARRLDAWGVMHDIRLAQRAGERIASRGSLNGFFAAAPMPAESAPGSSHLTRNLEEYEQTRDPQLGRQLVREQRALEASPDSLDHALAEAVEQHYRNANVRVAITAEMLNRFVAAERSEVRPVRDYIAGTPVRGRSHTQSESRVRLDPATGRWQLSVEADGVVTSDTLADGGRARLRSQSATDFSATKSVMVHANGVHLERTVVGAATQNRLVGVTTDFDWVPLFGSYARDRAVDAYRARRARAAAEVKLRVSSQAADQIDEETQAAVARIERQVRQRVTDRLKEAGVDLTPVELTTTHERLVGRFRVAGRHQLGSHTPRPQALSDSLASFQLHETALTNAAVSLELDGRRFSGEELQAHIREKFPRMAAVPTAQPRRDALFHFAAHDALQFHIEDGRLELTLSFASLNLEGRLMRDFIVHAYYVLVASGLEAELARDGSLGIEGRLSSAERARLHNVFNEVLPTERRLPIVRLEDPDDSRLAGLMITQLVLEDGWLGLAVGPADSQRVAERSRSLR